MNETFDKKPPRVIKVDRDSGNGRPDYWALVHFNFKPTDEQLQTLCERLQSWPS